MTSRIVVALRVKASPGRAFDVFTQEIGLWWQHKEFFKFTPRSPGVLSFEPPSEGRSGRLIETLKSGKVFEIGDVRVWEPGERLVVGWRQATFPAGTETEVEVRFEPVGEETRITVEHRGWDHVPAGHVAKHAHPEALFLRRHGEYWQDLLAALAARVG
ncbi:MAG: SRPBCC domain-containing protein [Alphaproteobacteria bacterium]|nr:SRPBCC domain-containing protein [Alphaproteobacteria bacterium]